MADKPTPLCPLLMQGALSAITSTEAANIMIAAGLHIDPALTACRGSHCAAWDPVTFPEDGGPGWGRCGMARAPLNSFPDPAGGGK